MSIMAELNKSGLTEAVERQSPMYVPTLHALAELAGQNREFVATNQDVAKRHGSFGRGSTSAATLEGMITGLVRVGVLERRGDRRYEFASYQDFVEIAKRLNQNKDSEDAPMLPPILR